MILKKIGYGSGIAKNYRVGSGIGYPSVTVCKAWIPKHILVWANEKNMYLKLCDPRDLATFSRIGADHNWVWQPKRRRRYCV